MAAWIGDLYQVARIMAGPRDKTRGEPVARDKRAMEFNRGVRTAVPQEVHDTRLRIVVSTTRDREAYGQKRGYRRALVSSHEATEVGSIPPKQRAKFKAQPENAENALAGPLVCVDWMLRPSISC